MSKAFLSHSSHDKTLINKIAEKLGRNNCHYDTLTFEAGKKSIDEIFKGLENTDIFVLFISEYSLESDWVKKEISKAHSLSDKKIIERIFPLIIDESIKHNDSRIPDWIKKPYNLKFFDNEVLILKKIKQFLREYNLKKYSHLKEMEELFVGRHEIIQDFERKIITIDNIKPSCIIVSSFFEGIGRRTFLKNGLLRTGMIDKWYDPIPIVINEKESLEDFIYKLNFVDEVPEIFKKDFSKEELKDKIELAKNTLYKFIERGELLFIIDNGSIVLPNNNIVEWFKEIIKDSRFQNQLSICIISKFKPYYPNLRKMGNIIGFQVDELSVPDSQILFLQYLRVLKNILSPNDTRFFMNYLKGIPTQIIYTANLINSVGSLEAKNYVGDIEEFDELRALSILDFLETDELSKQILIALSRFDIISYDLVYKIFGENEDVNKAIQKLYDLSLFYSVSSTHQYLKLNSSISDYINRSRIKLNSRYNEKIKDFVIESLKKPLELNEHSDYSEFLLTLQSMVLNNQKIPSKFLIPSFILKSIIIEYNQRNFESVITLSEKLLENENKFDYQIIRETKIWLCLAYCRTQNSKFFELINFFRDSPSELSLIDYNFLLGFYYRNSDDIDRAEDYYLDVLKIDENHSRTKRELVNVYLRQGEYGKAIKWARDNYLRFRTNILHIQAYFTCLIKKTNVSINDKDIILELLESAKKSRDAKASNIYKEMKAEYDYYVDSDYFKAISSLKEILKLNPKNFFAFKALLEIYLRSGMNKEKDLLVAEFKHFNQDD